MKFIESVSFSNGRVLCVIEIRNFVFLTKITLSNIRSEAASTTPSRNTYHNPYNAYHKAYNLYRV